jgi:hypothetical protein
MEAEHSELKDRYPWAIEAVLKEQLKSVKDTARKSDKRAITKTESSKA